MDPSTIVKSAGLKTLDILEYGNELIAAIL
jgi:hypothetical protein